MAKPLMISLSSAHSTTKCLVVSVTFPTPLNLQNPPFSLLTDSINMKTFNVTLSRIDNPDRFKFITVEECVDMDDCINHVHSTEKEFIIDAIREV